MRQLTLEDRMKLRGMIMWWLKRKDMREQLGCSDRTIRREIERWSTGWQYYPKKWQEYIDTWRRNNGQSRVKLLQNNWYREVLLQQLEPWYSSPDSIAGSRKVKGESFVCTKTIYNYIWLYDWGLKWLLTYKKRYKKRNCRQWKRPAWYRHISTRDHEADERSEIWHTEIDLVMSKWKKGWLITLVDRKSRYWVSRKVESKDWEEINRVLKQMIEKEWITKKLKTITSDNGHEFFLLRHIEKELWFKQYYADPYSSRQRWTNEQYNRQIRKLFPKWTIFAKIAPEMIQIMQDKINRKPRKILWYRTPEEVFFDS